MAGNAGYAGYQGYDPAEEARIKRLRETANMLDQSSSQQRPIRHWTQGVAQLAEAWLAKDAGREADKAETAFSDNRKKAADMLINAVAPGDASMAAYGQYEPSMMNKATALASGSMPEREGFNGFTSEQQAAGERNARLRALTSYMGDPMAAISADQVMNPGPDYQLFQGQDGAITRVDKTAGKVQQLQPGTPKPADPVKWDTLTDGSGKMWRVNPYTGDKEELGLNGKPPGGDGPAPPSGYRWTKGGGLEPIPGGPADKAPGAGMDPEFIKLERAYADDWDKIYGDYSQVNQQYNRAKNLGALAAKDPKSRSAADLALIVTLTKMLDPTSVAREGEVKLTQSSASLVDQAANLMNQWQNGQTILPDNQRQALLNLADTLMPSYTEAYQKRAKDAYSAAKEYGFSPNRVMQGFDVSSFERNEGVKSAEGNPWPTIRAQSGLPDNYSDLDPETASMIDAVFGSDNGADGVPDGVDPADWKYFTPEMKQQYLAGGQ